MAHIGFVGLGHMGLPMAINLLKAGHHVMGFDLNATAMEAFTKAGGMPATSVPHLAQENEILITMLQTGEQVMRVCLGESGLFSTANQGTLFIDCSSIDVNCSHNIHQQASAYGITSVEAPVSGGVTGAVSATLTFMVGGREDVVVAATPILTLMGKKIIHTGDIGTGQAAKICNNMILGISMIAVAEAFTLANQLGLSPQKLFEVVTNASGQCWVMDRYVPVPGILDNVPANHDYQAGFTAAMMLKDLRLSQQSAMDAGITIPIAAHATQLYQQFDEMGMSGLDFSAIIKLINDDL